MAKANPKQVVQTQQHDLVPTAAKNRKLVEAKQRQIAQGACRVFFKKGFHRTTIREIALACGMSMGQLYHYISGKDDVLFLVYQDMQRLWLEHLAESRIEDIDDPAQRLTQALRCSLEFMINHHDLFLFVYTETKCLDNKFLRQVLDRDNQGVVGFWRSLLEDVLGEATTLQKDFAANLVSFLLMFPVLRGWNLKQAEMDQYLDMLTAFVFQGLGLEPLAAVDCSDGVADNP